LIYGVLPCGVAKGGTFSMCANPANKQMNQSFTEGIFGYHSIRIAGDVENYTIATSSQQVGPKR